MEGVGVVRGRVCADRISSSWQLSSEQTRTCISDWSEIFASWWGRLAGRMMKASLVLGTLLYSANVVQMLAEDGTSTAEPLVEQVETTTEEGNVTPLLFIYECVYIIWTYLSWYCIWVEDFNLIFQCF